eukprot:7191201-Alexandrium_andersonii.AAC.1
MGSLGAHAGGWCNERLSCWPACCKRWFPRARRMWGSPSLIGLASVWPGPAGARAGSAALGPGPVARSGRLPGPLGLRPRGMATRLGTNHRWHRGCLVFRALSRCLRPRRPRCPFPTTKRLGKRAGRPGTLPLAQAAGLTTAAVAGAGRGGPRDWEPAGAQGARAASPDGAVEAQGS